MLLNLHLPKQNLRKDSGAKFLRAKAQVEFSAVQMGFSE
jgi:hypothetical protein